jgi:hypothetical protein
MLEEALIGIVIIALIAVALVTIATRNNRKRRAELRQRFGPEYDRAVEEYGSPARAERALASRAKRVQKLHVRELGDADRIQFTAAWQDVQARFVDEPQSAVHRADELIKQVMRARGYPIDDFEQRVDNLSVDHANVVQHYRAARALTDASRGGRTNTEELRQAFVHYRALFAELLGEPRAQANQLRAVTA